MAKLIKMVHGDAQPIYAHPDRVNNYLNKGYTVVTDAQPETEQAMETALPEINDEVIES
jgi:hypothetical protein